MSTLAKPIAVDVPTTPMPTRIPNPAVSVLKAELVEIERRYNKALDARGWHETLARRAELDAERLSARRGDIEAAIKAIKALEGA